MLSTLEFVVGIECRNPRGDSRLNLPGPQILGKALDGPAVVEDHLHSHISQAGGYLPAIEQVDGDGYLTSVASLGSSTIP